MKIAVTGSNGVVGKALIGSLDTHAFEVVPIDLPKYDLRDLDAFIAATAGCDAIIHLAWVTPTDNFRIESIDLANVQMIVNAYKATMANKIPRIIMASSNHAQRYDMRDTDGKIRASIQPATPDSPYGAEKIFLEALGRYYAATHKLEVICVRIGTVTAEDKPMPSTPDDPTRYWSHADIGRFITCCLGAQTVPDNFQVLYGVSNQDVFDWTNPFGYVPED